MRASDTVSRLGGDEFVIIFGSLADPHEATAMLKRLCGLLAEPYQLGEQQVTVPPRSASPFTPTTKASRAFSSATPTTPCTRPRRPGAIASMFTIPSTKRSTKAAASRAASSKTQSPATSSGSSTSPGGHARRQSDRRRSAHPLAAPERGLLNPDEFLPVVEYVGLNVELGRWVLDTAFAQAQAWRDAGLALSININVAVDQLQHRTSSRTSQPSSSVTRGRPSSIELEIVETAALRNLGEIAARLWECQALGFRFAVDDFGTGYSSLSYLKSLPVDTLKIDQVFVRDMLDDPEDLAIVEGVIAMAGAFRRSVIAEGMETAAHGRMLLSLGCELA